MKQLELQLQKRLLIVEFEDQQHLENVISCHNTGIRFMSDKEEATKLICKGSELTEEIAKELVEQKQVFDTPIVFFFKNYKSTFPDCINALQSFISAIESNNMFWKTHKIPYPSIYDPRSKTGKFEVGEELQKAEFEYNEAETRTFNPDKTLIFEILS